MYKRNNCKAIKHLNILKNQSIWGGFPGQDPCQSRRRRNDALRINSLHSGLQFFHPTSQTFRAIFAAMKTFHPTSQFLLRKLFNPRVSYLWLPRPTLSYILAMPIRPAHDASRHPTFPYMPRTLYIGSRLDAPRQLATLAISLGFLPL